MPKNVLIYCKHCYSPTCSCEDLTKKEGVIKKTTTHESCPSCLAVICKCRGEPFDNWEKWIQERKVIHQKLVKKLKVPPEELLMNIGDEQRSIVEERLIVECLGVPREFDKYRGNPAEWKMPPSLANKSDPKIGRRKGTEYFATKTMVEKNIVPAIQYIGTPDAIYLEKNIFPRVRNIYTRWKSGRYRKEIFNRLSSKIDKIVPHKPDHSQLAIFGEKIQLDSPSTESNKIHEPIVEEKKDDVRELLPTLNDMPKTSGVLLVKSQLPRLSLEINGTTLDSSSWQTTKTMRFQTIFEYDSRSLIPLRKGVIFKNTGLATIRIYFKEYERFRLFRDIYQDKCSKVRPFSFNKNELLIIPSETIDFSVWFQAKVPGSYTESWEICTVPKIWNDDARVILIFQGLCYLKHLQQKIAAIQNTLEMKARNHEIKKFLDDVVSKVKYRPSSPKIMFYTDDQLFEAANPEMNIFNSDSKYLFDINVVKELKDFYNIVKQSHHPQDWTYSVQDLKKITREKDIYDYVQLKLQQRLEQKEARLTQEIQRLEEEKLIKDRELSKIKKKDDNKDDKKKDKKESKDKELKKKKNEEKGLGKEKKSKAAKAEESTTLINEEQVLELRETHYNKLLAILNKLERPSMIVNNDRKKYLDAYFIVSSHLARMCYDLAILDETMKIHRAAIYPEYKPKLIPLDELPDRMVHERFDDIYISRTKRVPPEERIGVQDRPKPENLKDIPLEDTKRIYKIYFNLPSTPPSSKGGKGKGREKGKAEETAKIDEKKNPLEKSSGSKKSGNVKKDETREIPDTRVKANFDPFALQFSMPSSFSELTTRRVASRLDNYSQVTIEKVEAYEYNRYLLIYSHLQETVDALVDLLESKREVVSTKILAEIKKCHIDKKDCIYEKEVADGNSGKISTDISHEEIEINDDKTFSDSLLEKVWRDSNIVHNYGVGNENITDEQNERGSTIDSDKIYSDSLLEKVWKENKKVHNYFIEGKTKVTKFDKPLGDVWSFMEIVEVPRTPTVEITPSTSTEIIESVGVAYESRGIQTSIAEAYQRFSESFPTESTTSKVTSGTDILDDTIETSDMFYFLEDDNVEGEEDADTGGYKEEKYK